MRDINASIRERDRLKQEYPVLFEGLSGILARHDPIGLLAVGAPDDEYDPEVGTLLPRLIEMDEAGLASVSAVRAVVHEEFVSWFGGGIAGAEERYSGIAAAVSSILAERARAKPGTSAHQDA